MLHPVLLPDAFAGLGGHGPPLLVDSECNLLEVLLAAQLGVPRAEDLGAVPASAEALRDQLDVTLFGAETHEVRPFVPLVVALPPELDYACLPAVAQ